MDYDQANSTMLRSIMAVGKLRWYPYALVAALVWDLRISNELSAGERLGVASILILCRRLETSRTTRVDTSKEDHQDAHPASEDPQSSICANEH